MGNSKLFYKLVVVRIFLTILFIPQECMANVINIGKISLGFRGSQMNWMEHDGLFLLSNSSTFGFGFISNSEGDLLLLVIIHRQSQMVVWSANRGNAVGSSDKFVFDDDGNAYLQRGESVAWSTDTAMKGVSAMELLESGNLVLVGNDGSAIWQSFSHPTDTLLASQEFTEGMRLTSNPNSNNLSYSLEIMSGDMTLSVTFQPPQPYWSLAKENRRIIDNDGGYVDSAAINANSWRFYDRSKVLLWQFVFTGKTGRNATWVAVLGSDGFMSFHNLQGGGSPKSSSIKIPGDPCSVPQPCDPYYVCVGGRTCQCPSVLSSYENCHPAFDSPCNKPKGSIQLVDAGDGLGYFALGLVPPTSKTDLSGCKNSCLSNCSCLAMFFENRTRSCYLFSQIGSLKGSNNLTSLVSYIKVSSIGGQPGEGRVKGTSLIIVVIIPLLTILIILGLFYGGFLCYRKKQKLNESSEEATEEDNFLWSLYGMPVRYTYKELQRTTNDFAEKLGQGGFGSVYKGILPDGTQLAVKKLEGIGQGKKEFGAEVSIIGRIHHLHLVTLKGFCAEGAHRLLAYEYMAKGSLDRWLFQKDNDGFMLDWDTRYNIAVGTARGLAYLHEDCDSKIVHCDIKPENVLLDDHFLAKVSDFGLAKLMTREQSHVFTTLRGTRGYLAPEWITNYAISEKSDVYSYGMVLLEIIGGRKNYDPSETSLKSYFPSYAYKMMEEGKLRDIFDLKMEIDQQDERVAIAIKVAFWCIQDEIHLRPSMTKVVQMLEGLCPVPPPPSSFQMGARFYSSFHKLSNEEGSSTGPSNDESNAYIHAVQLSGPR